MSKEIFLQGEGARLRLFDSNARLHGEQTVQIIANKILIKRLNRGRDAERPSFVLRAKNDDRLRLHFTDG